MQDSSHTTLKAENIPHKMLSQDAFSSWLGIEILEVKLG